MPGQGSSSRRAEAVSIVIPSWSGNVRRLRESIERQTFRDYRVEVVSHVSPAARARRLGVEATRGELILFVDDDAFLGHERALEILVGALLADPTIGVVGSSKILPPDATPFQRRVADEIPRWIFPVLEADAESNPPLASYGFTGITTTCCLLRRSVFEQVGGFDESLTTAEDTDFFHRVRQAGYRFVIPADCWACHDPPGTLRGLLRKSFRYGMNHAFEARKSPGRHMDVVPLDRWYGKLLVLLSPFLFVPSVFVNVYFDPVRRIRTGFLPLKALSTYATFYGYTWGWFRRPR